VAPVLLGEGREIARLPGLAALSDAPRWTFHEATPVGEDLRLRLRPAPPPTIP
jgi:diaminohydroxyphosphoribosylaminopyrimidine deaminase/5-amino-6-(5-phosphoribosylamino)uracil reductase